MGLSSANISVHFTYQTLTSLTLAKVTQEHIEEGDVDRLVAAPVFLYLTQNHL